MEVRIGSDIPKRERACQEACTEWLPHGSPGRSHALFQSVEDSVVGHKEDQR